MREDKNIELFIINGQLIGCVLYIISLLISILVIYDQKRKSLGEKRLFTDSEVQNLITFNRTFILVLIVFFLILNYLTKQLIVKNRGNTEDINLIIIGSYLSIISACIALYTSLKNYSIDN